MARTEGVERAGPDDRSNGYEGVALEFQAIRSSHGRDVVAAWAARLPRGGAVVDIGAGTGEPLTSALVEAGLAVSAIDASPTMARLFTGRFPDVAFACEPAESSRFFDRKFDGALAAGLIFLLPPERQAVLLGAIAGALKSGGGLLFSAPRQPCAWSDALTGQLSASLGADGYRGILDGLGMAIIDQHVDEGGNHYYEARKA